MGIEDMHYDFKLKLNKIDSQAYRNLLVPEIDWLLNEAQEIFVKLIAEPRNPNSYLGFETSQRSIEDIRTLVVTKDITVTNNLVVLPYVGQVVTVTPPVLETEGYWYFLRGRANMVKGTCIKEGVIYERQHDDLFEESEFDKSSFEWKIVNAVFNKEGIKLYTNGFTVTKVTLTYIKKLSYIHDAEKFRGGGYKRPDGVELSGKKDCELPDHTHREIVDIAVMLASGQLQMPDYNIKKDKVNSIDQII